MFTAEDCFIEGIRIITPSVFHDERGFFLEAYNKKDFASLGITDDFVQDNHSVSARGVLRGLHFQKFHPQSKLVRAASGKIFDVAVDLRNGSETFGKYFSTVLDSEKQNMLYIPRGFAHGFLALTDGCIQSYKCSDFYDPEGEAGILWNDGILSVDWPSKAFSGSFILSEKDLKHPGFDPDKKYFDMKGNWTGE